VTRPAAKLLASAIIALTLSAQVEPEPLPSASGRVVRVADGDSFEVAGPDGPIRVRLHGIDTPEHGKPYWSEAKKTLSDLIYGKTVDLNEVDRDPYGRVVARVHVDGVDVNAEMVRRGAAWVYRKHSSDRSLVELEEDARRAKRGLWALRNSMPATRSGPVIGNPRSFVYHRPDCPDYGRVSARNRVVFPSSAAAEAAGYHEARNCPDHD
jgi:micrococcal nuclease